MRDNDDYVLSDMPMWILDGMFSECVHMHTYVCICITTMCVCMYVCNLIYLDYVYPDLDVCLGALSTRTLNKCQNITCYITCANINTFVHACACACSLCH